MDPSSSEKVGLMEVNRASNTLRDSGNLDPPPDELVPWYKMRKY